jgi:hypothetical protein
VKYRIYCLRQRAPQARRVGQIARDQIDRKTRDLRQIRGRPVQRGNLPPLCRQLLDQIEAEEPGAAGDEAVSRGHGAPNRAPGQQACGAAAGLPFIP